MASAAGQGEGEFIEVGNGGICDIRVKMRGLVSKNTDKVLK
jgi:hypothetical protein